MVELKPMELGEIVDRSATLWRAHWRKLYGVFFAFGMVQYTLLKVAQLAQLRFASLSAGGAVTLQAAKDDTVELLKQMVIGGALLGSVIVVVLFITLVETAAVTRYLMPVFLGQSARPLDGVKEAFRRLPTLLGLFLLSAGWSLLVGLVFTAPGVGLAALGAAALGGAAAIAALTLGIGLSLLGMVVWLLWFVTRFAVWAQVAAMEDVSALVAFRRCGALTSGRVGKGLLGFVKVRLTILLTLIVALLFMIGMVSSAPSLVLQAVYGNLFDPLHADPNAVPQVLLVPAELVNIAAQSIVAPLYVALQTIFYIDMRTRREGLDLELKLQ